MAEPACLLLGDFAGSASERKMSMMSALGQSVSFGRFLSESMDWERRSTFTHNKYTEEAERASRPGSVAQKKAFFEEHYRRKAAAAAAAAALQEATALPIPGSPSGAASEDQENSYAADQHMSDADLASKDGDCVEKEPLKEIVNESRPKQNCSSPANTNSPSPSARKITPLHSAKDNISVASTRRRLDPPASLHASMNFGSKQISRMTDASCSKGDSPKGVLARVAKIETAMNSSRCGVGRPKTKVSSNGEIKRIWEEKRATLSAMLPSRKSASVAERRSSPASNRHGTSSKDVKHGDTSSYSLLCCPRPQRSKETEERNNDPGETGTSGCFKARPLPDFYSKAKAMRSSDRKDEEYTKLGQGVLASVETTTENMTVTSTSHSGNKRRICCFNLRSPQ